MAKKNESLGPLELDVLRYVAGNHPITVREVGAHFAQVSGLARTTILTVMQRLREKGYLRRRQRGGVQEYSPTVAIHELLRDLVAEFVDSSLGGRVSPFVAYLTKSNQLTKEEARKLAELLEKIEARESEGKP
jgi:predicted transcriptional regulator